MPGVAPSNIDFIVDSPYTGHLTWVNGDEYQYIEVWENRESAGYVLKEVIAGHLEYYGLNGLDPSTNYCYKALGGWYEPPGETDFCTEDCETTYALLQAPTDIETLVFSDFIEIIFKDNSSAEDSFRIERKLGAGAFGEIGNVAANMEYYRDTTAVAGNNYTYQVRAKEDPANYSGYTTGTQVTANNIPNVPTGATISEVTDEEMRFSWTAPAAGFAVAGYKVQISDTGVFGGEETEHIVASDVTEYFFKGLNSNDQYWIRVCSYNGVGDSAFTASENDTTDAQYERTEFEVFVRDPNIEPVYIAGIDLKMDLSGFTLVTGQSYTYELQKEKLDDGRMEVWASATDLTHWTETITGSSTVNRESVEVHGDSYSCRFDVDASNSDIYIYESITLGIGKKNKIVIWYKNSVAGKTARVNFRDSGYNVYLKEDGTWNVDNYEIDLPNSTTWKKYELEFITHPDYSDYRFHFRRGTAASSSIYFDDVSIAEYPILQDERGLEFDNIWEDGIALTEKASIAQVEATALTWYWDSANQKLYVHSSDGTDPDNFFMEGGFTHLISNRNFTYADTLCTLPPWLSAQSIPQVTQEIKSCFEGSFRLSTGSISLINALSKGEYYFDKRFEKFTWIGSRLTLYCGKDSFSALADFKKMFSAHISDKSIEDRKITFSLRDARKELERDLILNKYWITDYPDMEEDFEGREKPKAYGYVEDVAPVPIKGYDATTNESAKFSYHDGRSKTVGKVTVNDVEKTKDTDYYCDLQRSIIVFDASVDVGEDDIVLVSFTGMVNTADEVVENGAEIFKHILNNEANIDTTKLNVDWIYETRDANTKSLSILFYKDTPYDEILKTLEHTTEAFILQDGDARLGLRPLQTTVPSKAKYIWNFQSKGHRHNKDRDSLYWKVRVFYGENCQSQEWQVKEATDNDIKRKFGVEKELSIYTYFRDPSNAQALATKILSDYLNKTYITDELPMILFDQFPGELIPFSRTRFYDISGTASELSLRILRVEKNPQTGKTGVTLEKV